MKILAINGSYRGDQGYTRFLIDKLFEGAETAGASCEVVSLARLKINHCLGCEQCQTQEHHLHCVYDEKDDVRAVFQKIAEADIIVYATPVYIFNLSGLLKTFLERLFATGNCTDLKVSKGGLIFHQIDHAICSKPFVTLVCCDNSEDETPRNVLAYFRTFSRFMDAPQVGTLVRNCGIITGHGNDPQREKLFPKIREVYAAYRQAGRELAIDGRIHRNTQRKANQEIIPVPFFSLIKKITWKRAKEKFIGKAREYLQ